MTYYMLDETQLARLKALATRLYSDRTLRGDEMRDAAQALDSIARDAEQLPIPEDCK